MKAVHSSGIGVCNDQEAEPLRYWTWGTGTLLMLGAAIVIQLSMRGTVDSHNWSLCFVEKPVARSYHV
jgi:hypothetical protein